MGMSLSHVWLGGGNGNPLQYSCLENPREGGAWWAAVHGVAQSRTRMKQLSSSSTSDSLQPHSLPGSSIQGNLQARILEWVAIPFSRGSSWPRDWIWVSCIAGRFFTIWAIMEAPRIQEWVVIPFFRGSSQPRDQTWLSHVAGRFFTVKKFTYVYMWIYAMCLH